MTKFLEWRRSFDIAPPAISSFSHAYPGHQRKSKINLLLYALYDLRSPCTYTIDITLYIFEQISFIPTCQHHHLLYLLAPLTFISFGASLLALSFFSFSFSLSFSPFLLLSLYLSVSLSLFISISLFFSIFLSLTLSLSLSFIPYRLRSPNLSIYLFFSLPPSLSR